MNPTILGVIGPGFLNQVPTLWELDECRGLCNEDQSPLPEVVPQTSIVP